MGERRLGSWAKDLDGIAFTGTLTGREGENVHLH